MQFQVKSRNPLLLLESGETLVPRRLGSYMLWKDIFDGNVSGKEYIAGIFAKAGFVFPGTLLAWKSAVNKIYGRSICGVCDGNSILYDEELGHFYCMCALLGLIEAGWPKIRAYSGGIQRALPESFDLRSTKANEANALSLAFNMTMKFIQDPTAGWLVLSGPTGTGKTHLARIIATALKPLCLYTTAGDMIARFYQYLSEPGALNEYVGVLKSAPILIIDDFGMEYKPKGDDSFVMGQVDNIIQHRNQDQNWSELPVVITTNIPYAGIEDATKRNGVPRIGSRLKDKNIVKWAALVTKDRRTA